LSSLVLSIIPNFTEIGQYIWSNKQWLFDGGGIVVIGLIYSVGRKFVDRRRLPTRNVAGNQDSTSRGHRFEFADGVIAYAKLRGSWENADIFAMLTKVKDIDDFTLTIAPLIYARAGYRLEKLTYTDAKDKRREIELELVEELKPEFAKYGAKLKGITIGSFVREQAVKNDHTDAIPLGIQTMKLHVGVRAMTLSGTSAVDILLSYRVTNPYDFSYASAEGPYTQLKAVIESEVRFELAPLPLQTVMSDRDAIQQRLLARLGPTFKKVGMTVDEVRILEAI
jgi:hypothetical protein